ncbi:MAG: hypothetical protein ACI4EG_15435 [Fusicatenibacter sp.]
MNNIFIEGIQGMGKSTLLQSLCLNLPGRTVCREGDYSPVDLAWCAWMTEKEYEQMLQKYDPIRQELRKNTVREGCHYVVTYTKILTDLPGFHRDFERFEIYNGRKSIQEQEEIITARYRQFSDTGYLFECAFLQNLVEELILFHNFCDDEIVEFYRRLYQNIRRDSFLLLYLYSDQIEESTRIIQKERADLQGREIWYELMMGYLKNSPYGLQHGCEKFEDLTAHFRHRQQVELRILREVIGENAKILPAKRWEIREVLDMIR